MDVKGYIGTIMISDNAAYLIEKVDAEENNLALHVQLCEQRYHQLLKKFDHVDQRFEKIETVLLEIKDRLVNDDSDKYKTYLKWAGIVISLVVTASVTIIARLLVSQ